MDVHPPHIQRLKNLSADIDLTVKNIDELYEVLAKKVTILAGLRAIVANYTDAQSPASARRMLRQIKQILEAPNTLE